MNEYMYVHVVGVLSVFTLSEYLMNKSEYSMNRDAYR